MAKTTRIVLEGDQLGADRMRLRHGERLLGEFRGLTDFQKLEQNQRRVEFSDGSYVELTTCFGVETALFFSPPGVLPAEAPDIDTIEEPVPVITLWLDHSPYTKSSLVMPEFNALLWDNHEPPIDYEVDTPGIDDPQLIEELRLISEDLIRNDRDSSSDATDSGWSQGEPDLTLDEYMQLITGNAGPWNSGMGFSWVPGSSERYSDCPGEDYAKEWRTRWEYYDESFLPDRDPPQSVSVQSQGEYLWYGVDPSGPRDTLVFYSRGKYGYDYVVRDCGSCIIGLLGCLLDVTRHYSEVGAGIVGPVSRSGAQTSTYDTRIELDGVGTLKAAHAGGTADKHWKMWVSPGERNYLKETNATYRGEEIFVDISGVVKDAEGYDDNQYYSYIYHKYTYDYYDNGVYDAIANEWISREENGPDSWRGEMWVNCSGQELKLTDFTPPEGREWWPFGLCCAIYDYHGHPYYVFSYIDQQGETQYGYFFNGEFALSEKYPNDPDAYSVKHKVAEELVPDDVYGYGEIRAAGLTRELEQ